jgi:ADP-dependent phosphofructokinase/glucokinase
VEICEQNIHQLKREYYSNFDYKAYISDYLRNIGKYPGKTSNFKTHPNWTESQKRNLFKKCEIGCLPREVE